MGPAGPGGAAQEGRQRAAQVWETVMAGDYDALSEADDLSPHIALLARIALAHELRPQVPDVRPFGGAPSQCLWRCIRPWVARTSGRACAHRIRAQLPRDVLARACARTVFDDDAMRRTKAPLQTFRTGSRGTRRRACVRRTRA